MSRQLFFMFKPTLGEPVDEVTIWLNVSRTIPSTAIEVQKADILRVGRSRLQLSGRFLSRERSFHVATRHIPSRPQPVLLGQLDQHALVGEAGYKRWHHVTNSTQGRAARRHRLLHRYPNCHHPGGDCRGLCQILQKLSTAVRHQELQDLRHWRVLRRSIRPLHLGRHAGSE